MPSAITITRKGGPEVLCDREIPRIDPGPGQLRIAVRAAGVNFADLMARMGLYPEAPPLPFCPGYEVAGIVDAVGEGVTNVAAGDRVLAITRFGGCAEEVVTDATMTFAIPNTLPFATAAAVPVCFATADLALFAVGALSEGERVLIHGGAGGVGTAAVRLAKRAGAIVIASAGSPAKAGFLRNEGVHTAINYRAEDVPSAVRSATDGEGVHLILDPRGGQGIRESLDLLCPLGRVVAFGVSELAPGRTRNLLGVIARVLRFPKINPISLLKTCRGIHGLNLLPLYGREDLARRFEERLLPPILSGEVAPVIHAEFPLNAEGARLAHEALHSRENIGKTVLVAG